MKYGGPAGRTLAYLVAFPIVLVLGVCLMQMAKYLPSAELFALTVRVWKK